MSGKQVKIHCHACLGGGIHMHCIVKDLGDGTHYYIAKSAYQNSGTFKLTKIDCRMAAVQILVLLGNPERLMVSSYKFGESFERGLLKNETLEEHFKKDTYLTIVEDFDHADELYQRLAAYDKAAEDLKAPYTET